MTTTPMTTPDTISLIYSGVQAFTTIVLVIITFLQMKEAKKSVDLMERSLKADFLPILMLGIVEHISTDKVLNIILTNCGKGIAIKPKVIFPGHADIVINSINVNENGNSTIEDYSIDYILTKVSTGDRKIIIEYHDVFNRKISTEANLIEINRFGPERNKHGISWDTWTPIIPQN